MDQDGESENGSYGRVTYRSRMAQPANNFDDSSSPLPSSRKDFEYSYVPIQSTRASSSGMTRSGSHHSVPDLFSPNLNEEPPKETPPQSSFKGWLTSGILDVLGAAAGVTLSTTGKLVAPPLHVTKTVLLPGMLALVIDTLDTITPPRVQDWFRILSSSVHHVMVVLGSTERGQNFSNQLYVVLHDILQVFSAPESRQVLVDGMAASVKFAEALNTEETKEFLEQFGTLGLRLLDAASSGKAKQLIQDSKDAAWKGIQMAADPSTTLALAEVTAHLCYALEDTQSALNPAPRKMRDRRNNSLYLNPYQMENFPEQVTMEDIILSCLGRMEETHKDNVGDDTASLQSKLTLDDEFISPDVDHNKFKDRKERVNVDLLRERVLENSKTKTAVAKKAAPINVETAIPMGLSQTKGANDVKHAMNADTEFRPKDEQSEQPYLDMEDIDLPGLPGGRKFGVQRQEATPDRAGITTPAIDQFYQKLDEFLCEFRDKVPTDSYISHHGGRSTNSMRTKRRKLKDLSSIGAQEKSNQQLRRFIQKYKGGIFFALLIGSSTCVLTSGLACYGIYSLVRGNKLMTRQHKGSSLSGTSNQEVVVRIVREVVHVTEQGQVLGTSQAPILTQHELDEIARKVASSL